MRPDSEDPYLRESISAGSGVALDMLLYELIKIGLHCCPSQDLQAGTLITQ